MPPSASSKRIALTILLIFTGLSSVGSIFAYVVARRHEKAEESALKAYQDQIAAKERAEAHERELLRQKENEKERLREEQAAQDRARREKEMEAGRKHELQLQRERVEHESAERHRAENAELKRRAAAQELADKEEADRLRRAEEKQIQEDHDLIVDYVRINKLAPKGARFTQWEKPRAGSYVGARGRTVGKAYLASVKFKTVNTATFKYEEKLADYCFLVANGSVVVYQTTSKGWEGITKFTVD
jgi:hypothetical protein